MNYGLGAGLYAVSSVPGSNPSVALIAQDSGFRFNAALGAAAWYVQDIAASVTGCEFQSNGAVGLPGVGGAIVYNATAAYTFTAQALNMASTALVSNSVRGRGGKRAGAAAFVRAARRRQHRRERTWHHGPDELRAATAAAGSGRVAHQCPLSGVCAPLATWQASISGGGVFVDKRSATNMIVACRSERAAPGRGARAACAMQPQPPCHMRAARSAASC